MRWLHISNLHYSASDNGIIAKELHSNFLEYLNIHIKKPIDNLFITGNFRFDGEPPDENETAENAVEFIWEIAKNVGIYDSGKIHIVPGNEESCGNNEIPEEILEEYMVNEEKFSDGTLPEEYKVILAEQFSFFKKINRSLYKGNSVWSDSLLPLHTYRCFDDYNLLYLNTAITHGRNKIECDKENQRGRLIVGTSILNDTLAKINHENPNTPIIVLAHHPLRLFNEKDREHAEKLFLDYNVILYLCSDTHEAKCKRIGKHIEITMGCHRNNGDTQEAFCEGEIAGDKIIDLRAHLWNIKQKHLEEYESFEKPLDKEHPDTAIICINFANIYTVQRKYESALEYYNKALKIREKTLGEEHHDTVETYNCIAINYGMQGDNENAIKYFDKVLKIQERILGEEHIEIAMTYSNIASVYRNKRKYDSAIEYYDKALKVKEKILGKEHIDTASTYNNLAMVHKSKGNYISALEYYNKALRIQERILGVEHTDTALTCNNIAVVYKNQRNFESAREYYEKALLIYRKILGDEHPNTAIVRSNIAKIRRMASLTN